MAPKPAAGDTATEVAKEETKVNKEVTKEEGVDGVMALGKGCMWMD